MNRIFKAGMAAILTMTVHAATTGAQATDFQALEKCEAVMTPSGMVGGIAQRANDDLTNFCDALRLLRTKVEAMERQTQSLSNAVVAFAVADPRNPDIDPCPDGWALYDHAEGRMIVGVSRADRPFATGGAREHTLTIREMPRHEHNGKFKSQKYAPSNNGKHAAYWGRNFSIPNEVHPAGGGRPHNNMPPYIALYYCKKEG